MEARQHQRVIVSFPAELVCRDKRVAGTIENLSDNGVYVVTAPQKNPSDLCPDTMLELRFQNSTGDAHVLHCKVKWSYMTPPHGFTNSVGMEIIDPPSTYKELLRNLR
ncbi:MAG: PilZ domain-containing protein [Nitrospirae bacterium]|nr:PilZ domain-containing protein [Nitrospirota bacterium]